MGFLSGARGAQVYKAVAKLVGGFELELEPQANLPVAPYPIIPPPTPGI
jgi:hypothetical protein